MPPLTSVPDLDDDELDQEELQRMWEAYVDQGRPDGGALRESLITTYYPYAGRIAGKLAQSLPPSVDRDDLESWAALGLLRAVKHYDPRPMPRTVSGRVVMVSASFKTYAYNSMRSVILDEIRKLDWAPRSLRKKQRDIDTTRAKLAQSMGATPSDLQVADMLGITVLTLQATERETAVSWHTSLEASQDANEMLTGPVGEELAVTMQLRAALVAEYGRLDPAAQAIVALAYYEDKKMGEIADLIPELNEAQVSAIHRQAIERLHRAMMGCLGTELLEFVS